MSDTLVGSLLREVEWISRRVRALHRSQACCSNPVLSRRLDHEHKGLQIRCREIERIHLRLQTSLRVKSLQMDLLYEQLRRVERLSSYASSLG